MVKNNVFYIGSLHHWQGIDKILEIASHMADYQQTFFHIVGGGSNLSYYKNTFSHLLNVRFYGAIHPTKIKDYWEKSDLIIMLRPSTLPTESTIPLKLIEAIKYKKLILASRVNGLTELLNSKNSILTDYDDNQTIIEILKDPELYAPKDFKIELEKLYSKLPNWKTQSAIVEDLLLND